MYGNPNPDDNDLPLHPHQGHGHLIPQLLLQIPTPEPRNATPRLSNVRQTPTPNTTKEVRNIQDTNPVNPWSGPLNVLLKQDPDFPMFPWGPDDTPKCLWVWDQPVPPNPAPSFTAAELAPEPEVITIYDSDNEMTSSPTESELSEATLTQSDTTIKGDPEPWGTPSIPTVLTLTGQTLPLKTGKSSDLNELLPGISGGRTLNKGSMPTPEGSKNPWHYTSPPTKETLSSTKGVRPLVPHSY
ncbi:hypothetical protein ARMGADRAFT_1022980 [Armillaria gallica]|uniref:Uncharacterized protein n=1 Tax=Armillaria gallica TaxID=47427 RepID=A0A2H3EAY1_ARMGA|nr:hypothetical protein ARMGADRAFT_1022980 [Armillaria gallica]